MQCASHRYTVKSLYKDFSSTPWQGNQLTIDKSQFTIKNLIVTIRRVYNNPHPRSLGNPLAYELKIEN